MKDVNIDLSEMAMYKSSEVDFSIAFEVEIVNSETVLNFRLPGTIKNNKNVTLGKLSQSEFDIRN